MLSIVQERIQYLQELGEFLGSARRSVKDAAERLGWNHVSNNQVASQRPMLTCPLNSGHRVAENCFQDHVQACKWRREGYLEEAVALPESCADLGTRPRPTKSIVIDDELAEKIIREAAAQDPTMKTATGYRPVPQTSDRLVSDFTTAERRAMYDYVVSQTGGAESVKLEDLQLSFESEKKSAPKSQLEILAEERDAKRRRMSYRSKKVSTNRKSHTEVMREVIQNQMHLYETWLKKDEEVCEEENENEDYQHSIKQECLDDEYDKYENETGKMGYNYMSRTNSDKDEVQSQRGSSNGPSRNSYTSSTRDKYRQDRLKYTDSKYGRNRESGQGHSREHHHDYRDRSRDGHNSRRREVERGYRDKESRSSTRDKYHEERRSSTRDKYHEKSRSSTRVKYHEREKGKIHRPRSRDKRSKSFSKEERNSKYINPEGDNDSSSTDILHRSVKGTDQEQKYSQTKEFGIFQDMQRLLDAQVAADAQRELIASIEDDALVTSIVSRSTLRKSKDWSEDSDEGTIRHKSRSHKRKKRKKGKHKKRKNSKKSKKKEESTSSSDDDSSGSSGSSGE